jgi:SAM-dependent methyltransferase
METHVQVQLKVAKKLTDQQVAFLQNMIDKGGPEPQDYEPFDLLVHSLNEEGVEEMREILSPILNNLETMQGFAYTKPYGYAGDFKIIDMIYESKTSADPRYHKWDLWWNRSDASKAVRNRKNYFIELCTELDRNSKEPKEVLVLGSGPATDVCEYLSKNPNSNIHFDLVDLDDRAIDYAKSKNHKFKDRVDFFRINVLRFKTHKHYDLIWSAGLFDYFKEKHFIYLVKKYLAFLDEQGEMIIGNFSKNNPTRCLMESVCGWYLNYRSEYELYKLAIEAGLREDQVKVDKEPLGVNLFLRIKMKKKQFTEYKEPISKVADYSVN